MILIFDWGDTIMRDIPGKAGAMADWEHVEYIPGIENALKILSEKHFCAVATNAGVSDTALMKKALERVGADVYFNFFTSSRDLGSKKPDPLFFNKIASILGVPESECIHIGNVYEKDITGARDAGMHTIFFNEKGQEGEFPAAERVISHMDELLQAVSSIETSLKYRIEICCDSLQSAIIADRHGANRIELCAGLMEGGLTPSVGTVLAVLKNVHIPVNVLIRPRPGNFCYDEEEIRSMIRDIEFMKRAGVSGLVCGALTPSGDIDIEISKRLLDAVGKLDSTYHRAFDVCRNPEKAVEEIIAIGYKRILTSGQMLSAEAGLTQIENTVRQADNRIIIMPGAGISENNIEKIARTSGAREFHMSLRSPHPEVFSLEAMSVNPGIMQVSGDKLLKVREILNQLP